MSCPDNRLNRIYRCMCDCFMVKWLKLILSIRGYEQEGCGKTAERQHEGLHR